MHKIYQMKFSDLYQALLNKVERKGFSKEDLNELITWLMDYQVADIEDMRQSDITYQAFFEEAPELNPNRKLITGVICGVRVEEIEDPLMQEIRYLDKLVDELARGKKKENIFRQPK